MEKEIFKDIEGYEGIYQVSNFGKIRKIKLGKERILRPCKDSRGYSVVSLFKNKTRKMHKMHRLIAIAFIPNPANKPQINHKDGNKLNNNLDNLEWNTALENVRHSFETGLNNHYHCQGEKCVTSKLKEHQVMQIRSLYNLKQHTQRELAKLYDCNHCTIWDIIHRKKWKNI